MDISQNPNIRNIGHLVRTGKVISQQAQYCYNFAIALQEKFTVTSFLPCLVTKQFHKLYMYF